MIRSTGLGSFYKAGCTTVIAWLFFSTTVIGAFQPLMLVSCSLGGLPSYGSPVVVFFFCLFLCFFFIVFGHPHFRVLYSTVPVDVVRVKS